MRQLVEVSYDDETKTCEFALFVDGQTHRFSAGVLTARIEGEEEEFNILRCKPALEEVIELSDPAWRVLGVCLHTLIRTGIQPELPFDLDSGAQAVS